MAGPATRPLDGQLPGWTGPCRNVVAVTKSDATIYDPPLRSLVASGSGNVVLVLDGDDETDSTKYLTIALTANVPLTGYAIRQVRSTNTTATGFTGAK